MILIDIYVPLMEKTFDFSVDENAPISLLIEELSEMICQIERWPRLENADAMFLCDPDSQRILPKDATLAGMAVVSGRRLMLV